MLLAVRPVVVGLLIWTAYDMAATVSGVIVLTVLGVLTLTSINPIWIILAAAVLRLVIYR
jgi:chromate transporter